MDLSEFVGQSAVRERLDDVVPNQGDRAENQLKVDWQTSNYFLIGGAFDYLLRFWLEHHADTFTAGDWEARRGVEVVVENHPDYESAARDAIDAAEDAAAEFMETGEMNRDLLDAALDLSRLDWTAQSGEPPEDLGEYDGGDIVDCIRLMEVLDECDAMRGSEVHMEPPLGLAGSVVGGAEADAVIDGTLIAAKTTSKATFQAKFWRQLVGYLVLADVHDDLWEQGIYTDIDMEFDGEVGMHPDIEEFGVYFARHGEVSTCPAEVVYEADGYDELRSWFIETAIDWSVGVDLDKMTANLVRTVA